MSPRTYLSSSISPWTHGRHPFSTAEHSKENTPLPTIASRTTASEGMRIPSSDWRNSPSTSCRRPAEEYVEDTERELFVNNLSSSVNHSLLARFIHPSIDFRRVREAFVRFFRKAHSQHSMGCENQWATRKKTIFWGNKRRFQGHCDFVTKSVIPSLMSLGGIKSSADSYWNHAISSIALKSRKIWRKGTNKRELNRFISENSSL